MMRIIAGQWRTRRLERPPTETTRPMPARVRQSIFDILSSYYGCPGQLPLLDVADVFAGSGSMGLEALSRGARRCTFYERDRQALESLRSNIHSLQAEARADVVTADAWRVATRQTENRPFDLIFLDPPYADSMDTTESGNVVGFLARAVSGISGSHSRSACNEGIERDSMVDNGVIPLVLLHHPRPVRYPDPRNWFVLDRREIGSNAVSFFRPRVRGTIANDDRLQA
ncbi:MAG: RsmD family RNA methyltransferase [Phycisphaerae bacterium]|nr:RsmD family RNA methyltransferase [Phycisphaerae bacterium]